MCNRGSVGTWTEAGRGEGKGGRSLNWRPETREGHMYDWLSQWVKGSLYRDPPTPQPQCYPAPQGHKCWQLPVTALGPTGHPLADPHTAPGPHCLHRLSLPVPSTVPSCLPWDHLPFKQMTPDLCPHPHSKCKCGETLYILLLVLPVGMTPDFYCFSLTYWATWGG